MRIFGISARTMVLPDGVFDVKSNRFRVGRGEKIFPKLRRPSGNFWNAEAGADFARSGCAGYACLYSTVSSSGLKPHSERILRVRVRHSPAL